MGPQSRPALSVVILCYRSEQNIYGFIDRMRAALERSGTDDYELILVGNYVEGTKDETPRIVKEIAELDAKVRHVAVKKAGWMGWDMRMGLAEARGEFIAVIDGDGQMPVADVSRVYDMIRHEHLDLVKTFRVTRGDGLMRRLISNIYNKLFHLLFPGLRARDMNAKPKILTRAALEAMRLTSDDWFVDAEIMIQARRLRLRVGEIPTGFLGLSGRRSFISANAVWEFIQNLVRYRVREFREKRAGR